MDKLKDFFQSLTQAIGEQQWAQELKGKWEELDVESRLYLKIAAVGSTSFLGLFLILNSVWSVHNLKQELTDKKNLLALIQNSTDELKKIQDTLPPPSAQKGNLNDTGPWSTYFEELATNTGMTKANFELSAEKVGTTVDQARESLFDINLQHVNLRQVVSYAVSLENGQRLTKIRNLSINTKADPSGYMDATFAVSGFKMVVNSK